MKYRDLDRGDVLPASWTDALQEYISTLTSNLTIEKVSASSIKVPAGTGSAQVAIGIGGLWRYRSSDITASMPGSSAATYAIWVSATANSFTNTPDPDTDETDYDFGLHITTGAAPTGGGITATRQIGELDYSGSDITAIRQTVDTGGVADHAATHLPGGSDELDWDVIASTINLSGTAGSRPAASAANAGYVYYATDTGAISRSTGSTWTAFTDSTKANIASPTFTGTPAGPTAAADTNTTQLATTAFVIGQGYLKSATAATTYAPLASPTFTGTPAGPTATPGTDTTQLATTAFVTAAVVTAVGGNYQPLDSDLTAISALTTTSFGRGLLTEANASSARTTLDAAATSHTHAQSDITSLTSDLAAKAPLASPTFTGTPAAPTAATATNTTQLATTAFVKAQGYATLASPTLTGTPAAPTAAADTNTTQVATTAYVIGQGYLKSATAASTYAALASPTFTGTPAAPTASSGTNTTQIATTAFVKSQNYATLASPTFTGSITIPLGSATTPGIGFTGDANTGIYQAAASADTLSVAVGGNLAATFTSSGGLSIQGTYQINGTQIAASNLSNGTTGTGSVALAASPALTGTPTAPTAAGGTNTTQIATTAHVTANYQPLSSKLTTLAGATAQDYTTSNVTTDRAFNANSTSLDELSDIVGTLIADLISAGVLV